jgi:hypothetical protein
MRQQLPPLPGWTEHHTPVASAIGYKSMIRTDGLLFVNWMVHYESEETIVRHQEVT